MGELSLAGPPCTCFSPFAHDTPYFIEPLKDAANNNEPPTIRFAATGEGFTGPPVGIAHTLAATVGTPVELAVWISDVKPDVVEGRGGGRGGRRSPLTLRWHLLRGPGEMEFADTTLPISEEDDHNPTTTATFGAPGEYLLRSSKLNRVWGADRDSPSG